MVETAKLCPAENNQASFVRYITIAKPTKYFYRDSRQTYHPKNLYRFKCGQLPNICDEIQPSENITGSKYFLSGRFTGYVIF
jgi:hypothetical protein